MLAIVENARRKQLDWVRAILAANIWRPSKLAREAGLDHSTISKFLKDPLNIAQLNSYSVDKIAQAGGIPPYHTEPIVQARGFAEEEAAPWSNAGDDPLKPAIEAIRAGRNGIDAWVMKSRALENAGFLPGDILMVDLNAAPADGDAVCVQLYDRAGRAETAFRIYENPFLVAACADPALRRPVLIDGGRQAVVLGVVIASMRQRLAA